MKVFKQVGAPPAPVKERAYPKLVSQGGDAEKYCMLKLRVVETIFDSIAVC